MKQTVAYRDMFNTEGRAYTNVAASDAFHIGVDGTAQLECETVPQEGPPCVTRASHDRRALADARANWDFRELMRCYKVEVKLG